MRIVVVAKRGARGLSYSNSNCKGEPSNKMLKIWENFPAGKGVNILGVNFQVLFWHLSPGGRISDLKVKFPSF